MTLNTWLLFVLTDLVLCLTPGPAVLFVVSQGLRHGRRPAVAANLGILTANAVYFALSAAGLGAVLLASHEVFSVIRYVGAAYLIYLGVRTFLGTGLSLPSDDAAEPDEPSTLRVWMRGTSLQAANPKALLFFAALLPQFIRPESDPARQILIIGATSIVVEFFVLGGYGLFAAAASRRAREPRFARLTGRVSGAMLVAAGAGIGLAGDR
jgi:homoserine/homoserine lactone efflux protein